MTQEQARELGRKSGREAGPGFGTFWYKKFDLDGATKAIGKVPLGLDCRMEENEDQVTAYADALSRRKEKVEALDLAPTSRAVGCCRLSWGRHW
jgi:hypothetical protein